MRANIVRFRTNRHLRSRGRHGNAILELGLLAMPLVVMLLGTVVVGLKPRPHHPGGLTSPERFPATDGMQRRPGKDELPLPIH